MTTPTPGPLPSREPGEPRRLLDRAPGERYVRPAPAEPDAAGADRFLVPLAIVLGGALGWVVLGGILVMTGGLLILAAFVGWLIGKVVSPPAVAGLVGLAAVGLGLLGIWAFGRIEGGVLDPIAYFGEVHGPVLVILQFILGGGLAAAASR
ncbi:MAG TPA: hypothetical protein VFK35_06675 [Candidatus Limnocylindrales bacterium]|nr:hypothetical protein [Candidatus Limnocylindrales bacterium]